jgi:hypothetical protein
MGTDIADATNSIDGAPSDGIYFFLQCCDLVDQSMFRYFPEVTDDSLKTPSCECRGCLWAQVSDRTCFGVVVNNWWGTYVGNTFAWDCGRNLDESTTSFSSCGWFGSNLVTFMESVNS